MDLPRILIIDDIYGRQVGEGYNSDRINLCKAMLLKDATGDQPSPSSVKTPVGEAVFCRGQRPIRAVVGDCVENDLDAVVEAVRQGWNCRPRGLPPWALVLLDLAFTTGRVTPASNERRAGEGEGRTDDTSYDACFGMKVLARLDPLGQSEFHDLPVVVLSRLPRQNVKELYSRLGAVGFIEGNEIEPIAAVLRGYLWRHGLLADGQEEPFSPKPIRPWTPTQLEALRASDEELIVGYSIGLLSALREARRAAPRATNLFLSGDTGTGKELLSKYIWRAARQPSRPFAAVDSGALVETLAEDTLFGHVPGAADGIRDFRVGKIREADGGDLFLDEIGYLPPTVQLKLMRAVAEGEVQPLGTDTVHRVSVRFLSATDRPIERWVTEGRFNNALFARLAAVRLPPLPRLIDRRDDIPLLVQRFFDRALDELRAAQPEARLEAIDNQVFSLLADAQWPENVRGLRHAVQDAVQRAQDVEFLSVKHFSGLPQQPAGRRRAQSDDSERPTAPAVVAPALTSHETVLTSRDLAQALMSALRSTSSPSPTVLEYTFSKAVIEATISDLCQRGALRFAESVEMDNLLTDTWHSLDGLLEAAGIEWRSGGKPVRHTMKAKARALNAAATRILTRLGHHRTRT